MYISTHKIKHLRPLSSAYIVASHSSFVCFLSEYIEMRLFHLSRAGLEYKKCIRFTFRTTEGREVYP